MYIKYAVEMALHGTGSDSLELANSCAGNCTRSRMEQNIDPHAFWLVEISCDVRLSFSSTWLINAESTDIVEYCQDNPPWSSESIPLTYINQRFLDYNIISIIEKNRYWELFFLPESFIFRQWVFCTIFKGIKKIFSQKSWINKVSSLHARGYR